MKTILPILFAILIVACKKTETQPINNVAHEVHGMVTVEINSNFTYPFVDIWRNNCFINQGGGGKNVTTSICLWNNGESNYKHATKISYIINSKDTGSYYIHSFAHKNINDSTLYMKDGNKTWLNVKAIDQYGITIMDSTSNGSDLTCKFIVK